MHGGHHWRARHQRIVFRLGTRVAGIDARDVGPLPTGGDRVLTLPIRQGAPAWVGSDEIHQMRGDPQAVSEAVGVVEVGGSGRQAGLLDGLREHPVDVEVDGLGFG